MIGGQRLQLLLATLDTAAHFAGFVEQCPLAGSHCVVEQAGYARELEDDRIGLFQGGKLVFSSVEQAVVVVGQLQRVVADVEAGARAGRRQAVAKVSGSATDSSTSHGSRAGVPYRSGSVRQP